MNETIFLFIIVASFSWILLLGTTYFFNLTVPERWLSESVKYFSFTMFVLATFLFVQTFLGTQESLYLKYPDWIQIGDYRFKVKFLVDTLANTYALLSISLIGIIFKFSRNYLHKEEGYFRFILLLSILQFGLLIVSFASALDLFFIGWELVGTTSVLLISYFYSQNQPVKHSLKAIITYRLCDMGILAAGAWSHHYLHSTDFTLLPSLVEQSHYGTLPLIMIGLFIIWASLGKAGQLPMSSWFPTAMEGPTPSSAIFYGALSVHLGPFLLLRWSAYLDHFPSLHVLIGLIGPSSAIYATIVGRTRSDAKTTLAYSTISQVGLIYIEIALGLDRLALFHIVAHASLRTYQFLRSSSLIQDFFNNPRVVHNVELRRTHLLEKFLSSELRTKLYLHALDGFHLDFFTDKVISLVFLPVRVFLSLEKKWMGMNNRIFRKIWEKE